MEQEVKIIKVDADWKQVKNECRNTINKEATEKEPTRKFIQDVLISEHSPIRLVHVLWRFPGIKSWVSVHFARHWLGWDKWVSTQRQDRTGVDRNQSTQDTPVNMDINANAQALINVARYRLCYQASPETRKYMENVRAEIKKTGETELAHVMVPNCVYRCGCPEFMSCGFWKKFKEFAKDVNLTDIRERYKAYEEYISN